MLKISEVQLAADLNEYLKVAEAEPVEIKTAGGKTYVLLSTEEYEHLQSLDDAYWGARASAADAKGGYLSPEESMRRIVELLNAAP